MDKRGLLCLESLHSLSPDDSVWLVNEQIFVGLRHMHTSRRHEHTAETTVGCKRGQNGFFLMEMVIIAKLFHW